MAKFHGSKNLVLGGDKPWAAATYDDEAKSYVIELDEKSAAKFRALNDEHKHGFVESDAPAKA